MNIQAEFDKRKQRVTDCVNLKEPDRVPIIPVMEAYPVYYGGKTIRTCMESYRETESCFDKFFDDYKPDLGWECKKCIESSKTIAAV